MSAKIDGHQRIDPGASPTFAGQTVTGLTASKPVGTNANKALASLSPISVVDGGTGVATLAIGGLLTGNTASVVQVLAPGATTTVLVGGGAGTAPVWTTAAGSGAPVRAGTPSFTTGIGVGGAAAGTGGVAFPASAVAVADANTLDDYEEGTWTPDYRGSGGSAGAVASTVSGTYTKIGRLVTLRGSIVLTNNGDWTGNVRIHGVPFTIGNYGYVCGGVCYLANVTFDGYVVTYSLYGWTWVSFAVTKTATTTADISIANTPDNGEFNFIFSYFM